MELFFNFQTLFFKYPESKGIVFYFLKTEWTKGIKVRLSLFHKN